MHTISQPTVVTHTHHTEQESLAHMEDEETRVFDILRCHTPREEMVRLAKELDELKKNLLRTETWKLEVQSTFAVP